MRSISEPLAARLASCVATSDEVASGDTSGAMNWVYSAGGGTSDGLNPTMACGGCAVDSAQRKAKAAPAE